MKGNMKMNVDAAISHSSNLGAVGVVCRNADGRFVAAGA
uniref:Uncharacterized protein n=1 Tax=Arundo donax TaxID=35708 RepID=A0A0A9CE59_ARUDO